MTIRCIDAGTVPFVRSQSIYHGLGHSQTKDTPDTIVLATPASPYICIGNFQNVNSEIDRKYCNENSLPIIRRQTGGGAVYIDQNQLFIQWIFQSESLPAHVDSRFEVFMKPLIETHKFFGIDAYYHPINDVHVDGKKIVGTGAATIGNAEVITGNFLFDFDFEKMSNAFNLPGDLLREYTSQTLRKYLTTISRECESYDPEDWRKVYLKKCDEILGLNIKMGVPSDSEMIEIEKWDKKLVDETWISKVDKKNSPIKLLKIHSGFWISQIEFVTDRGKGYLLLGMNETIIEDFRIDFNIEDRVKKDLGGIFSGLDINSELEAKAKARLTGSEQELLMSIESWIHLIVKVRNERKRISGHG